MTETLLSYETAIRLGVFASLLVVLLLAETVWPRKNRVERRVTRWRTNLALTVIDGIALRIFVPLAAVGSAAWAAQNNWGLFNLINTSTLAAIIISVIILDMMIYWQHVATHKIPILWRFHQVHHADRDIDVTTGVRFHPIEICLSMVYKMACVLILGAPVAAVIIFELILNGCALFNHANLRLPKWLDRILRIFIVTPDMHRVHHSTLAHETNSNYGFSLSLWDRLFGSYINQPSAGHNAMKIGLSEYQDDRPHKIFWSLTVPFKR